MQRTRRAQSVASILNRKRTIIDFAGVWKDHIGRPEQVGSWIVYGASGHGKTSYCTQLAAYFTNFGKVLYVGLEEGDSLSFAKACLRAGLGGRPNFKFCEDSLPELELRLKKRNSADFVFIDSLQMAGINFASYKKLKTDFPNKIFIYVSHADGSKPEGRVARKIEYFSHVKVRVEGYKAFVKSRYEGKEPFVIYPERASEYWKDII